MKQDKGNLDLPWSTSGFERNLDLPWSTNESIIDDTKIQHREANPKHKHK